jgi:type I restriction enzyme S subunit
VSGVNEVNLGDVASVVRTTVEPGDIREGTLYVGLENITTGGKFTGVVGLNPGGVASTKFIFSENEVLFGKLRPYLAKIARPSFGGVCSTDILPISPGPELDRDYLAHFLLKPATVSLAAQRATGANLPRLSPKELERFRLPLPSLREQRRIAEVLDAVDTLRTRRRQAVAFLDELTRSIFVEIFGDQNGNPKLWPIRSIEDVCSLTVDCVNRTAPIVDYKTPFKMIRTTNVKAGKVDLSNVRYVEESTFVRWNRRATPRRGDVLLTREAPVGESGILNSDAQVFLGQRLMLYRPSPEKTTSEYLLASFQSPFLKKQFARHGSGSTVKHLPLPACRSFDIVVPPLSLQQAFSIRIQAVESLKASCLTHLAHLDAFFASLQDRAFKGEL